MQLLKYGMEYKEILGMSNTKSVCQMFAIQTLLKVSFTFQLTYFVVIQNSERV